MAVDERCGSVVFAEQAAVDVVEPISRDEPVPAGGTCETLREGGTGREGGRHKETLITNRPKDQESYCCNNSLLEQRYDFEL